MQDGFGTFVDDTRCFLRELAPNNSRDWFLDNKARYDAQLKAPAMTLLEVMSPPLTKLCDQPLRPKLFRAQRDVRFSKDKTPYHLHLHLMWVLPDGEPSFFFGISEEYVTAGAGWMAFSKAQIASWRDLVDSPYGSPLSEKIDGLDLRMDPPELKRVPAPYDKAHPRADLLRRKSFALWQDHLDQRTGSLEDALKNAYSEIWPVLEDVVSILK